MNSGESTVNGQEPYGRTTITEAKAHTQSSIDSIYYFYYFTYNNVSDFVSGYSNTHIHAGEGNYANSFSATKNTDSPLTFVDNVEIKEINFIPGTKNVYYKIYNKDKGSTYYGLIDVKLNKVVYNIEADNSTIFIPDTTGNMLLITSTDIYRVCTVKSTESDSCENPNTCSNLLLDPDGNKCQENCDEGKIKMMPESICINSSLCDLNIYVLNTAKTECGLCNYFYPSGTKYKLINTTGCLNDVPNNTEYYNQLWNIYKCKENYHLENSKCLPDSCYETCETCNEVSNNETDQKCSSCKTGYTLIDGNCIIPQTTIITHAPTTILKIPTTVPKIQTTIVKIPTTIPKIPTTIPKIPTTVITTIPTTILKIPLTSPPNNCEEKCLTCNEESTRLGLCLTCNEAQGYKKVNYTIVLTQFLDCRKEGDPKLINYYFNETFEEYRPCYKTCKRCSKEGNPEAHHCLECANGYMFRPINNPYNNCVVYSDYHYYISSYDQFKTLDIYQCPEEAKYYNKEKKIMH